MKTTLEMLTRCPPLPARLLSTPEYQTTTAGTRHRTLQALALLFGVACVTAPATATIVFNNGFEGGTADWGAAGPWDSSSANASVSTTSREGTKSVKFLPVAGGKRSELTINDGLGNYQWGTEYWIGFSVRVVQQVGGFGIIHQHHSVPHSEGGDPDWSCTSGPNSFTIKIDGSNFKIMTSTIASNVEVTPPVGSATWGTESVSRPFALGQWYDFVLHFRYALNSTGFIKVWMNGEQVVDKQGPTVYRKDLCGEPRTQRQYQKIGSYYGTGNNGGELLYDAFRIWQGPGGSYNDVAPGGGGGGSPPAAPGNLAGTAISSTRIDLTWADNATNETGFKVERKTGAGSFAQIATPAANATSHSDANGLSAGTTYTYRVRANNASGDSGYSNQASATTPATQPPVTYQGESLTVAGTSGETVQTVAHSGASGGSYHLFNGDAAADFITYTVNVASAGTYLVETGITKASNRGTYQLKIDGTNRGSAQDYYGSNGSSSPVYEVRALGTVTLAAGNRAFRFECTGKNASASQFKQGLDFIRLTPQ